MRADLLVTSKCALRLEVDFNRKGNNENQKIKHSTASYNRKETWA